MRSLDLPQILYQPFAATGDKNTILNSPSTDDPQRANLQTGFPPITQIPIANGGIPPERMDFNGLGYLLSSFYFFTQCGGVYTFNRNVSNAIGGYPLGAVLYYTDSNGTTYKVRSLLENNTFDFVTTPSYIDDKHWAYVSSTPITQDTSASSTNNVFSTAAVQSLLNTVVHKTGNETIAGVKTFSSSPRVPTVGVEDNSTKVASTAFVKAQGYAVDSNVVHKTGNETIAGVKTFTGGMITDNIGPKGSITLGTSTNTWGKQLQFIDTKGKRIARIQPLAIDTTNNRVGMWVNNADNTVEKGIYVDSNGYTQCPKPADNSNTDAIATTNWAGGLNRENTWNGLNTFKKSPETHINGNARYKSVCTGYTKGTAPTTNQFGGISTTDKNGVEVATIYSSIDTNNNITSALWVKQPTAAGTETRSLAIWCDKNGVFHTSCGVPSAEPNSIVTTIAHSTNYVRFGNGLIIQWIFFENTGATTWIFPTPFSDTNYAILSNAAVWYNTANKQTTLIQITDTNFGDNAKFNSYYLLAIGY